MSHSWGRQGALLPVLGLLVSASAMASGPSPSIEELRQHYAGEWRFSGGSAERAAVPAAVERSVDGMFFISRGIAYDRLIHVCEVCATYSLSFSKGEVEVSSPCQVPDKSPDDGREVDHLTKAGDASKLSQRFVQGMLVQEFRGEGGTRRVVWTLAPDQESLSVQYTITSHHLPHPVDYTLSYRRIPPATPASSGSGPRDAGPPGG
jgi:hypothetical protein